MATSSIFTNVVIEEKDAVERFLEALEDVSAEPKAVPVTKAKLPLTDPKRILAMAAKRAQNKHA